MEIYRTLCPNCGEELNEIIVEEFRYVCPKCDKTLPDRFADRRTIKGK